MSPGPTTVDLTVVPTGCSPVPGLAARRFYIVRVDAPEYRAVEVECVEENATLVSSQIAGSQLHAPALDLDVPAYLVQSSTPGHSHLYLDVPMSWWRYRLMLWALALAGVLEPGYYKASVRRRASYLRRPGVTKTTEVVQPSIF